MNIKGKGKEIIEKLKTMLKPEETYYIKIALPHTRDQQSRFKKVNRVLAEECGYTEEEMQTILTWELWGKEKHTSEMSTSELALLIDHVQMRAAEMGIYDDR